MHIETLVQAGLLNIIASSVVATVKLLPINELYIAFDFRRRLEEALMIT